MEEDKRLLKLYLNILHIFGYNVLKEPNIFRQSLKAMYLMANFMLYVLTILYAVYELDTSNISVVNGFLESFVSATQIFSKAYTLMKFKKEIKYLLEAADDFWELKNVDDEVINVTKKMLRFTKIIVYSFIAGAVWATLLTIIIALVTGNTLFLVYVPNKYYLTTKVVTYIQIIFITGGCCLVSGFDGIFVYLCYKCVTQQQILKYKYENLMDYDDRDGEINKCIEHHAFLLKFIKKLTDVYNMYFLVQYFVALVTYSTQTFPIVLGTATQRVLIRSLFYMGAILIQFVGCNCYVAQQLTNNAVELERAIYNCKWYNGDVKIAKKSLVALSIAQREIVLRAGGLTNINVAVLGNLFRATYSIVMFLYTLQVQ